jgi:hypothetical protein
MVPLFFVCSVKGGYPGKNDANYRRSQNTLIADIMPQNHPLALSQVFP